MERVSLNFEGDFTRFEKMSVRREDKEKSGIVSSFLDDD